MNTADEDQLPKGHVFEKTKVEELAGRFARLFSSLTEEGVGDLVGEVYADDAYLNDTLKEVRGVDSIREYLIESGEAVHSCQVHLNDLVRSSEDYYVRWTMDIRFKKLKKGQSCRSQGISHLRFDQDGKIFYHQDYWDSAGGIFEHIPILGSLIRLVKKRL
jgi:hypothetical protein